MKQELLPRPLRACLWATLVIILAVIYYIALGCPTLTIRQELRRAEKVHMVGPSKIVDQLSTNEYFDFETMLVGETDYGILFFGRYGSSISGGAHGGKRYYCFNYQEKTGDVSFAAPPNVLGFFGMDELPVYVFTEHKNAVRATISITAEGSRTYTLENGEKVADPFRVTLESEAIRNKNGYFRFHLTAEPTTDPIGDPFGKTNDQAYALFCLSNLCNEIAHYDNQATMIIPIIVTLYDAHDREIVTRELQLGPYELPKQ